MGSEPRYVGEEMGLKLLFDEGTGFVYPADEVDELIDQLLAEAAMLRETVEALRY